MTNNVALVLINALAGLSLAPVTWMACLPLLVFYLGGAFCTGLEAKTQKGLGRKGAFQLGSWVALVVSGTGVLAVSMQSFTLLLVAALLAGYYSANGQMYRFAASELCAKEHQDKAVSWVIAGGLVGTVISPNLAMTTKGMFETPYVGSFVAVAVVALLSMLVMRYITFTPRNLDSLGNKFERTLSAIVRQPVFVVAALAAALGSAVMQLLIDATPLVLKVRGFPFEDVVSVMRWHVIGMFAPCLVTGHLIKRLGSLNVIYLGALLYLAGIAAMYAFVYVGFDFSVEEMNQFLFAMFLLGLGWNFLFTGSTSMTIQAYTNEEKTRAQAAINFCVFVTMAIFTFAPALLMKTIG